MNRRLCYAAMAACQLFTPASATSQEADLAATVAPRVVAVVNGQPLLAAEVQAVLDTRPPSSSNGDRWEQALEVTIQRSLVLDYLRERNLGATRAELDDAIGTWSATLQARDSNAEQEYARLGLTEAAWRRRVAWQIGWERYRTKHLAEPSLAKFFAAHASQFDGTRVKVAHLLLPLATGQDDAMKKAARLREQIVAGQISFEEATKTDSIGKTAAEGGELGWINANGPMTQPFTEAAMALAPGQLSPPVQTRFGVHLIRCLQIEPGTKTLADVLPEVRRAAELRLFKTIVSKQLPKADIQRSTEETD